MQFFPLVVSIVALFCASCASLASPSSEAPSTGATDAASEGRLGKFSQGSLAGWQEKSFSVRTHYEVGPVDGRAALTARCEAGASGLYRHRRADLEAIDAVAVMTDCDDTRGVGLAHYGNIYFTGE